MKAAHATSLHSTALADTLLCKKSSLQRVHARVGSMHLHDEHIWNGTVKDHLHHKTISHGMKEPSEDSDLNPQSHSTWTMQEHMSTVNLKSEDTQDSDSESQNTPSFTSIVNRLIQQVGEDEDDEEVTMGEVHAKIADLFNYVNRHWTHVVEKVAFQGLGE
jgi:hypothetical protein